MNIGSKALGSSLIVVISFSFLVSLLLFGIFNVTYSDRHEFCSDVSMRVTPNCETRQENIRLTLANDGSINMYYEVNSEIDSVTNVILSSSSEEVEFEKDSTYKIVPHVKGEDGELYACVTQTQYVGTAEVPKCQ
ncbi:MAG: hypothetical protein VX028_03315 [Nanoarchaeota archaeon]|nr:hypothetical protein [Nanoarchaeota archaeon]